MAVVIPILSEFDPKGLDKAVSSFKRAEGGWAKTGAAAKAAFVPALGALGGIAAVGLKAANAASDLGETMAAVGQIFGDSTSEVEAFADTAAASLGQSKQQALDAAKTFGTFGKAAGLSGDDLASFSTDFVTLASDLASFNNTEPQEAIEAIGSALRGEAEPMRKYGVLLDDASLRQEALAQGLIKTTKQALTPQQKILAAQALIYKKTGDAQGDFARTSEGAANQQRILNAQMEDAQAEFGQAFLPILKAVTSTLAKLAGWVKENTTLFVVITSVVAAFAAIIVATNIAMSIYGTVMAVVEANQKRAAAGQWALNAAMLANPVVLIVAGIVALIAVLVIAWKKSETFRRIVTAAWNGIKAAVDIFVSAVRAALAWIGANWKKILVFLTGPVGIAVSLIIKHWDKIKAGARAVLDWLKGAWQKATDWLVKPFELWWSVVSGIFDKIKAAIQSVLDLIGRIKLPKLPDLNPFNNAAPSALTTGVGTSRMGTLAAATSSSTTVNVSGALDPEGTAREVQRMLDRHASRQGRVANAPRRRAW